MFLKLNIYWCHEKHEDGGLFVAARNRGVAKALYSEYIECDFRDVRTELRRRSVTEEFEGIVDEMDSPILGKYGLSYCTEEE